MSSNIPTISELPITQDFKSGDKIIIYRYPLAVDIRNEFPYSPNIADFDQILIKTDQVTFQKELSADSNQVLQILNFANSEYTKLSNNLNNQVSKKPVSYIIDTTEISTDTLAISAPNYIQPIKGTNKKITGKNNLISTNNFLINQNNATLSALDSNSCDSNSLLVDRGVINLPKGTYRIGASITLSPEIQEDVSDYQKYTSIDQVSTLREKDLLYSLKESGVNPVYDYALPLFGINLDTHSGYSLLDRDGLETPVEQSDIVSLAKKQQQVWSYLSFDRLTAPEKTILNGTGGTTFNVVGGSITLELNGYFYNETNQQYGLRVHALGELSPGIISNTYNQSSSIDQIDRSKFRVSDFFNRTKFTQTRITIDKVSDADILSPKIDSPLRAPQPFKIIQVPLIYEAGWVNKLQATTQADEARRQFGWVDEQMSAFVVGSKEIRADRVDHNPPSSSTVRMFPLFQSKGTLDGWKEIADFYNRDGMELHQYILGLSFGSPFMQFVPQCASLFHVYSQDPGLGKTTAMMAGASIWGNPELILLREVDTHASKMNRAELYKNIFLPIDEMTNVHPKEASDFLYQLTGGMQRNRQSQNANMERARGETWHTNACSTGNTSLLARVRMYKAIPKAEATRVLEYEAQKFHFDTKAETDVLSRNLYAHYGHACIPLMQYVIANMDECRTLFLQTQERIDIAAGLSQPHRFWSVQAASAITGLLVAKRLGLIKYKISDVVTWLIGVIQKAKQEIETMSGTLEDTLTSFLAENYNNILRIKSTDDARNASDALEHLIIPDASPRISLVARYEYDVKKMYLLPKPLREWCNKQQINYQTFVESLKSGQTRAVVKKVRMGKGTNMNLPPSDALVIDCSEFMSDEVEQTLAAAHVSINLPTAVQQADQP